MESIIANNSKMFKDCKIKMEKCSDEEDCIRQFKLICSKRHHKNVVKFINALNTELKQHDLCFVSGTYIFEDTNLKLFDFLYHSDYKKGVRLGQKILGTTGLKPMTHNLHINEKLFKKHKISNTSKSKLITRKKLKNMNEKSSILQKLENYIGFQYEIDLQDKKINFVCDPECDDDAEEALCALNKESKKSVLFYPFCVKIKNEYKIFTFVKLEKSPTINLKDSLKHAFEALQHYYSKSGAQRKNLYKQRREDVLESDEKKFYKYSQVIRTNDNTFKLKKSNEEFFAYLYEKHDDNLLSLVNDEYDVKMKLNHYNNHVRTRNELFVPEEVYSSILEKYVNYHRGGGGSNKLFIKTNEHYKYNNYNYVVYKHKNKKYIRYQSKYVSIS